MSNENATVPYDVLIVEDNADDVELLLRVFRQVQSDAGMEINAHAISNSTQAGAQLDNRRFDAIFLDVEMPPPNGLELAKRIRNSETNKTTPIIIITGGEDRGLMTRAFRPAPISSYSRHIQPGTASAFGSDLKRPDRARKAEISAGEGKVQSID